MSHAEIAIDQLRNADDIASTPAEMHAGFLTAALVHAVLALRDEVRGAQPPMYQLVSVPSAGEASVAEAFRNCLPRP